MITTYENKNGKMTILRDPNAVLDYGVELVDWLTDITDTLQSVTTIAVGVTADSSGIDGTICYAWVSGGTLGQTASLTFRFVTVGGRTDDRTIYFNMKER